jgi:hypothetical protein
VENSVGGIQHGRSKGVLTQSSKDHCSGLLWSRNGQEKGTLFGVSMFCCAFKKASAKSSGALIQEGARFRCPRVWLMRIIA